MPGSRQFSFLDRLIGEINLSINVLSAPKHASRAFPAAVADESQPNPAERDEALRLMRVNHSGEVAAQALYRGQALTARDPAVAKSLEKAADEEMDHLAWCEQRLRELRGHTSILNPLWYTGSFAIGALAGALGDRTSLGFIAETERQVEAHLRDHLSRLPQSDGRSRAVVEQMRQDEMAHGATADAMGAATLPAPVRTLMRWTSRIMTRSSHWL